jgi:hypothetical protein
MAKIEPSALISEIRGKWHGDTFQMHGSQIIVRRTGRPRQARKASRALYKGQVANIAGCYDGLTASDKTSWACYADLLPTEMSGFNAYLSRNVTNLTAGHEDLDAYHTAPSVYSIPPSPAPIDAQYCALTDRYCVSWTTPPDACYYVQGHYAPQAGFSNLRSPAWRLRETVAAARLYFDLDGSGFPSGTVVRFRARTLNVFGEPSPWTATATAAKT